MKVVVQDNQIEKAIRDLKKKLTKEGFFQRSKNAASMTSQAFKGRKTGQGCKEAPQENEKGVLNLRTKRQRDKGTKSIQTGS